MLEKFKTIIKSRRIYLLYNNLFIINLIRCERTRCLAMLHTRQYDTFFFIFILQSRAITYNIFFLFSGRENSIYKLLFFYANILDAIVSHTISNYLWLITLTSCCEFGRRIYIYMYTYMLWNSTILKFIQIFIFLYT